MEIPIEGCESAYAYKKAPGRRLLLLSAMVAMYAVVLPYCFMTAGEPRMNAMKAAQDLADARFAAEVGQHTATMSYRNMRRSHMNRSSMIPNVFMPFN
jgi:hypothetical protein